jgi:hypothetical protein
MEEPILVTGDIGTVGGEVVRRQRDAGQQLQVLGRRRGLEHFAGSVTFPSDLADRDGSAA